jgi:hypothetical protein
VSPVEILAWALVSIAAAVAAFWLFGAIAR